MRSEDQEKARRVENENYKQAAACNEARVDPINRYGAGYAMKDPEPLSARQRLLTLASQLRSEAERFERLADALPFRLPYEANAALLDIINLAFTRK